jgi:ribosomal protein L27
MPIRRRLLKALAAAGLLGPAGISGLIRDALAKGDAPIRPGLHKVRGEVIVNHRVATEGQLIRAGDTIVTGRGSEAIYVIGQDAFMQRELTTVNFGADAVQNLMRVVSGKLLSVFGKGAKTIQVSTATIGIRGTGCYIEDEGTGAKARTYFCLCYGNVELTPTAAPQERERYSTVHHDKPMYIHNDMKMPKMMVPAGVINHSDAELELLESLVGRLPPFYGQGGTKY